VKALRSQMDRLARHFEAGGKLERWTPLWEAVDTFLYTTGETARSEPFVRDALDYKRLMTIVVIALLPCFAMACFNTGYQASLAIGGGAAPLGDWQNALFQWFGLAYDADSALSCALLGALYFLPVYAVAMATGIGIELVFAVVRRREISEGFFVTGALLPLILPPTIPLWQVAFGTAVGLTFSKEVFGGTGMNFLNPALACRAILFFAYPAEMSGDAPWTAADLSSLDGVSGATFLARAAAVPGVLEELSFSDAFIGLIPGSMGETSALACLLGAVLLIVTEVASWRIMAGVVLGTVLASLLLNQLPADSNPMLAVPFWWHMVLGGWALGTVYMSTDPVSSSYTEGGRWLYGMGIGVLCVLIRCVNPAFPEGMMLAILFMNMFAPLIDHFAIRRNVARRIARSGA